MNRSNNWLRLLGTAAVLMTGAVLNAQTADTGAIKGRVTDDKGQPLPGAVIRAKGPQGSKGAEADSSGNYTIPYLTPGAYELTVTMDGYNTVVQPGVDVKIQSASVQPFKLSSGGDVLTITSNRVRVDTGSSVGSTSVNLGEAIEDFARSRDFASAFDFSAGVVANSGVGGGNPAISGASGLENQYIISGVNITNSGYGGIGAYDAVLGPTGVGVTTDFLESMDIQDGGFQAEYGGALGGVITATVKSGTNDWKGSVAAYYEPSSMEGSRRHLSQLGGFTNTTATSLLDIGLQVGGPIIKDKLFFFAAYNPTWSKGSTILDISASDLAMDQVTLPYANREVTFATTRVDNFAGRLTWNINEKHKLDFILFGSPQSSNGLERGIGRRTTAAANVAIPVYPTSATGVRDIDPAQGATGDYKVSDYAVALKYFGTITPWMNVEAQIAHHRSKVEESPSASADVYQYNDIRRLQSYNIQKLQGFAATQSPGSYAMGGFGLFQGGASDKNTEYSLKVTNNFNAAGSHELKYGLLYADIKFREELDRSGPRNDTGAPIMLVNGNAATAVRLRTGGTAQIRCNSLNAAGTVFVDTANTTTTGTGVCRTTAAGAWVYRLTRGNFNPATPDTTNKEMNLFVQDKWTINTVTLNLGVRYTRSKIAAPAQYTMLNTAGGAIPDAASGGRDIGNAGQGVFVGSSYSFKGEYSPRLGISWDVMGNGKSRLYANVSRIFERIPNDLAVRSLGNEFGLTRVNFSAPDLSVQTSSPLLNGGLPTVIENGTRLPYKDDLVIGYEFELAPNFKVEVKGNYRKQGRVLEDIQVVPVEAIQNYYYNLGNYVAYYYDAAEGARRLTYGCAPFGEYRLANVGENNATRYQEVDCGTGVANGVYHDINFGGKPQHKYKALSVTLTKQPNEGEHLGMQAVYSISRLTGNYEGLFRNDNGQDDPNISSLFDFPNSFVSRSQYFNGRLNNDIPHKLRMNVYYKDMFIKGLTGSATFKWQSGTPRTPTLAHPEYQNAGEIPGVNPQYVPFGSFSVMYKYDAVERGYLGRNPDVATWDGKLAYDWNLGKSKMTFDILVENIFNNNDVTAYSDFIETQTGVTNPNYLAPAGAHAPRNIRLGVKWSF